LYEEAIRMKQTGNSKR